ncbi:MAG: hypothetical protein ACLVHV_07160 [Oscillospiraceae bacterium]
MKILITGAGGFLGRNLSAELQNLRGWTGMDGEKSGRLELLLCHRNTDLRDLPLGARRQILSFTWPV